MSTTSYPLATLAFQVTPTGPTAPPYNDILLSLQASAQSIFGADIDLDADTQDGQLLAVLAKAVNDANQQAIAAVNAFSPTYAQGTGLASLVKINGLTEQGSTNSTALLQIVGVTGTPLNNCSVQDQAGYIWSLPVSVVIPVSGEVTVTAVCQTAGAISASANTINIPYNPVAGWQSVTNPAAATAGIAGESDAALRSRQANSTSLPAQTTLDAIFAAVADLSGAGRVAVYENPTKITDADGIPANSIAVVVEGGTASVIAQTIEAKKAPGTGTYGTTSQTVLDPAGLPITINYFPLADVPIFAQVTIQPLAGYVATTGALIAKTLASFINALSIGGDVYLAWASGVASLTGNPLASTFVITALTLGLSSGSLSAANVAIAFNQAATCSSSNVVVTVL